MKRETKLLPISEYQKRFFLEWTLAPQEILYNVSMVNRITGNLNRKALKQASEEVIKCNEIFFARYSKNGEICWRYDFSVDDFYQELTFDQKQPLELQLREILNRPFDLTKDVLVRFYLVRSENVDNEFYFIMTGHHIIADAIHAQQISIQIQNAYNQIVEGKSISLSINKTFSEAVEVEKKNLTQEYKVNAQKFWLDFIGDFPLNVDLPYRSDVEVTNFNNLVADKTGNSIFFDLNRSQTTHIKAYAKEKRTTLFIVFSALYGLVLSKYCNQGKLLLSYPINMRPKGFNEVTGCFVNNVPLKLNFTQVDTFEELLELLGEQRKEAKLYQGYSLTDIIQDQRENNDREISSFFNVGFTQTSLNTTSLKLKDLDVLPIDISWNEKIVNEIGLLYDEYSSEVIRFRFEYRTALFDNSLIQGFVNSFKKAVDDLINYSELLIKDYSLLNHDDYNQIVYHWNETNRNYPRNKTICQLFLEQVNKTPYDIAVVCNDQKLTYKELNEKSNQLARCIRKHFKEKRRDELTPDTLIPLFMDRGLEVLIGILAVLKSGGAYVPIDLGYPQKRIDYILENTQAEVILSLRKIAEDPDVKLPLKNVLCIDLMEDLYVKEDKSNLPIFCKSTDLAYVIYTSGTTGNPKGVLIEHQSLVNYVIWGSSVYVQDEKVLFPLYTSISFDLTVTSLFIPLLTGNSIIVYPENDNSLPIEDVIRDNKIQILKATPSHLKIFKESRVFGQENYVSNIKRFIVGGESFTTRLANEINDLFKGNIEIYNEYGPTEATVGCMIYKFDNKKDKNETVPIGTPIDNAKIYLLDDNLKPVPIGVVGHMYISGDCLSRGYLFKPDLTKERFIKNPYCTGKLIYKTGDVAKRLPCGDIEFIGRKDQQVKVNGYRIELEEIVQHIIGHQDIKDAVVIQNENDILCAYVTLREHDEEKKGKEEKISSVLEYSESSEQNQLSKIQDYLSIHLPHYMIPRYFTIIESIPLTKNGKVNYTLLPKISNEYDKARIEGRNHIENLMVSIWKEVLSKPEIGVTDNFFRLGGDSIKAVQIASRLFDKNILVNVKDILTYQNIDQLCKHAEIADGSTNYEQGIIEGEVELNPIQSWFFEQDFKNPNFYNQSVLLRFNKPINKDILQKSYKNLIEYHDALRMNYDPEKKVMIYSNRYLDDEFKVEEYHISKNEDNQQLYQQIKSSFDITNTLLIKPVIIKVGDSEQLFITVHHLVIDGISWRILLEDFYTIYKSLEEEKLLKLPKKTATQKEWCNSLREYSSSSEFLNQSDYWIDVESANTYSSQDLQSKKEGGLVKDLKKIVIHLNEEDTAFLLKDANIIYNTNIEILLVTSLVRAWKELNSVSEIRIEMESHGRHLDDIDISRTIGWFTSMFPVKFALEKDDIGESIKYVKEKIKKVPNHGIGHGILRYMNESIKGRQPLCDVRFNYLGQFDNELNNDLFSFLNEDTGTEIDIENYATSGIEVNAMIIQKKLIIETLYNKYEIKEEDIKDLMENFERYLHQIIEYTKKEDDIHFTPSDFDLVNLDDNDLAVLFEN